MTLGPAARRVLSSLRRGFTLYWTSGVAAELRTADGRYCRRVQGRTVDALRTAGYLGIVLPGGQYEFRAELPDAIFLLQLAGRDPQAVQMGGYVMYRIGGVEFRKVEARYDGGGWVCLLGSAYGPDYLCQSEPHQPSAEAAYGGLIQAYSKQVQEAQARLAKLREGCERVVAARSTRS